MARVVVPVLVLVALVGGCSVNVPQPSPAASAAARYQLASDGNSMIDVVDGTLYSSTGGAWEKVHGGPQP